MEGTFLFGFSLGVAFILAFELLVNVYIKKNIIARQKASFDKLFGSLEAMAFELLAVTKEINSLFKVGKKDESCN